MTTLRTLPVALGAFLVAPGAMATVFEIGGQSGEVILGDGPNTIADTRPVLGHVFAGAGDVDGDGHPDLVIGSERMRTQGVMGGEYRETGGVCVIFSRSGVLNPVSMNASLRAEVDEGFCIDGVSEGDRVGASVAGVGDVNGDGRADLLIGAPGWDSAEEENCGAAYVVFGRSANTTIKLGNLGVAGYRLEGANAGDAAGTAVAAIGDVNGDGKADVLVGAPGFDAVNRADGGAAYVSFGRTGPNVQLRRVGSIDRTGFRIRGGAAGDAVGGELSGAGDVNGDGRPDVLLGAPSADPFSRMGAGAAWIVFGTLEEESIDLGALGAGGYRIVGATARDAAGVSVAAAGDVNGDGLADVLVGATGVDVGTRVDDGAAYVVFGKANDDGIDLGSLASGGYRIVGRESGDLVGRSVASAGDVNGDGIPDALIASTVAVTEHPSRGGAYGTGAVYLVLGRRATTDVGVHAGPNSLVLVTDRGERSVGGSIAGIGDVNGDGRGDFAVGSVNDSPNAGEDRAIGYVVTRTLIPLATTGAARDVSERGATLEGSVDCRTVPFGRSYQIEYGTTTAYGTVAGISSPCVNNSLFERPVSVTVSGLSMFTTYHYRVVVTSGYTSYGADRTFRTIAPAAFVRPTFTP